MPAPDRMNDPLHISFFHANGYPSGVYRQFFDALSKAADVAAPALLDAALECSPEQRWPAMRDQALAHLRSQARQRGSARRALVGHSMGGYLALQVAAAEPASVAAVVLLDSPIPLGWRSGALSLAQATGLHYRTGPAPIAARRRDRWPSRAAAREFFAGKAFVKRWAPGVLDDFIAHALIDTPEGEVTLRVPRDAERDIYANIVHRSAQRALREATRAGVPVHFIAGTESEETRMAGWSANRKLFGERFVTLPTGHLIPLEAPADCAALALDRLRSH